LFDYIDYNLFGTLLVNAVRALSTYVSDEGTTTNKEWWNDV
jgi:hypothetical protein